ncbi:MAG: aminotransferase class III-fold pyridoxal phosphate-dependent enzyme [Bacteroidota bacterium]|nr:aminotransferase class III-fold pyridoxal phosphate-dependent enzyme [Bacteroidota bacterium]
MSERLPGRPNVTPAQAAELALLQFGIEASAHPLPSDRDLNFRLDGADGPMGVLKISNANENRDFLDLQAQVMQRLANAHLPVAAVLGTDAVDLDSGHHATRLVSWLEGSPLGEARPITRSMMREVGGLLARMDDELKEVPGKATPKDFPWNLCRVRKTLEERLDLLSDEQRLLVSYFLDLYARIVEPRRHELPHQLIHGDANDYNVLVGDADGTSRSVAALLDFGDIGVSARIADPAIAAAYLAFHREDPVEALESVLAGYHAEQEVSPLEAEAFFVLCSLRLCISVCMSAEQRAAEPDNAYLSISEQDAWRTLATFRDRHPRLVHYRLRAAVGWEAVPGAEELASWLAANTDQLHPMVLPARVGAVPVVFDFSVASLDWDADSIAVPGHAADAIWKRCKDAVGIGRWNEPRLAYTGSAYTTASGERRTVHIGVDLFRPENTPVHAPLDGVVHSFCVHHDAYDYGGCVLLEHAPEDGPRFWTLFGHLSHASVQQLEVGQPVKGGEPFVELGAFEENGGWVPHLHFQLITDRLDMEGTFPGVAAPGLTDVWLSLSPSPASFPGLSSCETPARPDIDALLSRRKNVLSDALSVSYDAKLHIVRGHMQWLFDAEGRAFLDAVNNVPHVGHSNPRVVDALHRQMRTLTTNTRYLHESVLAFGERLAATLPDPLEVCFFVNSGSEANDLAIRLARAATGRRGMMVLDGAYHGNLTSLIDISPYKFEGRGGFDRPATTHVVPMPDPFRGPHRGMTLESGRAYADTVRQAVQEAEVAAFMAESVPGCGGQIVPPPGYLAGAAHAVRKAGGVFIADEVQVGMGRAGSHFWGFQIHETDDPATHVVPDIVVLGKPVGNGHPLGAVVTTRAIADAFNNGMEYFNTFGGNPASCAVGLAVLDEIEKKNLQEHAREVGAHLLAGLTALTERHAIVGEARGVGLFVGVELVRNRSSLEPAAEEASYIANRMREEGILISTDGPLHNVLKIKPPMVFDQDDADRLVDTLDRILAEDAVRARLTE